MEECRNIVRNSVISFDCSTHVYQITEEWGFKKPKGVKIIDHLRNLEIEDKCGRNVKEMWVKCGKDVAEVWEKCGQNVEVMWQKCAEEEYRKDVVEELKNVMRKKCVKKVEEMCKKRGEEKYRKDLKEELKKDSGKKCIKEVEEVIKKRGEEEYRKDLEEELKKEAGKEDVKNVEEKCKKRAEVKYGKDGKEFWQKCVGMKCGKNLKSWFKKYKEALEATDFSSFDVTTMQDLLPVLCYDKFTQSGTDEYIKKLEDKNSIEFCFKSIKDYRNEVMHDYSTAKSDPKIDEKRECMRNSIRAAGALYDKDQSEIDAKITELDAKFDELVNKTSSSYEYAVQYFTNKIERECPTIMLEKYSSSFTVPLPGGSGKINTSQIFEAVNISVAVEKNDESKMVKEVANKIKDDLKKNKIVINSRDICQHVSNKFVVITGVQGSGKTTLMRNIFQNILENSINGSETSYKGIGRFRVPIYLECRDEQQNNLRDFLKDSIKDIHYPKEIIYDAFKNGNGLVFLIDGYDEANGDIRKLIYEIISFCKDYNATCIVSGRVDAGNDFISKLEEINLSYNAMFIEPITERSDKLSILRRYGDEMSNVDSKELVKSFENLNDSVQKVFSCPVLLALFISLFVNPQNSLSQLCNEQSIYKEIGEMFYKKIVKQLKECVDNPELIAKYLLEVLSDYSLRLFGKKEYFFGQEEILCLTEDCLKKLDKPMDIKRIFSCILTPEISLKTGKTTYAFTHSSIQEYLALGQIMKKMKERNFDWNSEEVMGGSSQRPTSLCTRGAAVVGSRRKDRAPEGGARSKRRKKDSEELPGEESLREQFLACLGVSTSLSGVSISYTNVRKEVVRYGYIIKLLMLELADTDILDKYARTFTAVLKSYFVPITRTYYYVSPNYLLELVSSSNCDSIVSIVSGALINMSFYNLLYIRHIKPMTQILKKSETSIEDIGFYGYESLTDTDCVDLVQLMSVLEDGAGFTLKFFHSHDNFQPLNEFYTQLNNINKSMVRYFKGCVASSGDLTSLIKAWGGGIGISLHLSSVSVSACDISFAILEEFEEPVWLTVKYTNDIPSTCSNPVAENTTLIITVIPADGKDDVYRLLKYLSPKTNKFMEIELENCLLTDTDIDELVEKLKEEKIRTLKKWKTEVNVKRVHEDKSRDLQLYLK